MNPDDLESLLHKLGFQRVRRTHSNIMACCPSHQETRPSWGISIKSPHMHGCFGCNFRGSLASMLMFKFGWDRNRVAKVAGQDSLSRMGGYSLSLGDYAGSKAALGTFPKVESLYGADALRLFMLSSFSTFTQPECKPIRLFLKRRGLTRSKPEWFYPDSVNCSIEIPWIVNNSVYGVVSRICKKDVDKNARYKIPADMPKGSLLYHPGGLIVKRVKPHNVLVLCEGELDAVAVKQAAGKDSPLIPIALGMGKVAAGQVDFLKSLPVNSVVLFFDDDVRGQELTVAARKALSSSFTVREIDYSAVRALVSSTPSADIVKRIDPLELLPSGLLSKVVKTLDRYVGGRNKTSLPAFRI